MIASLSSGGVALVDLCIKRAATAPGCLGGKIHALAALVFASANIVLCPLKGTFLFVRHLSCLRLSSAIKAFFEGVWNGIKSIVLVAVLVCLIAISLFSWICFSKSPFACLMPRVSKSSAPPPPIQSAVLLPSAIPQPLPSISTPAPVVAVVEASNLPLPAQASVVASEDLQKDAQQKIDQESMSQELERACFEREDLIGQIALERKKFILKLKEDRESLEEEFTHLLWDEVERREELHQERLKALHDKYQRLKEQFERSSLMINACFEPREGAAAALAEEESKLEVDPLSDLERLARENRELQQRLESESDQKVQLEKNNKELEGWLELTCKFLNRKDLKIAKQKARLVFLENQNKLLQDCVNLSSQFQDEVMAFFARQGVKPRRSPARIVATVDETVPYSALSQEQKRLRRLKKNV